MIVRAIDIDGDWFFGKGKNDYRSGNDAIAERITTRLRSFLGNCFFDTTAGIDWFNLLGSKNQNLLNLAIKSIIAKTPQVTGIASSSFTLLSDRSLNVVFTVSTVYSSSFTGEVNISI